MILQIEGSEKRKMSPNNWIQGAELIPENKPYKVDGSSRVIIPSHLKAKFDVENGDQMDYYTSFIDGKWFMCITKHIFTEEELRELEEKQKKKKQK